MLPNDLSETNRLDFQHFVLRAALKGNYAAPLRQPGSILDVGTGTGRWAVEMAELFPNAEVVGLDISVPPGDQPASGGRRPANYRFVESNVLDGLPFADASFDFAHMRLLFFGMPGAAWPRVFSELFRVTKPGGWVESVETSIAVKPTGPTFQRLVDTMTAISLKRGIDLTLSENLAPLVSAAGFQNVKKRTVYVPVGTWGGRVGRMLAIDLAAIGESVRPLMLQQGISEAEYATMMERMKTEWDALRSKWQVNITIGQRPA